MNNLQIGRIGEDLATAMLQEKGYEILCRNYRSRRGEIDVVALNTKHKILCFVEVKTRTSLQYGTPAESVTQLKQKKIRLAAADYLNQCGCGFRGIEFQVVEVQVRHLDGLDF